MPIIDKGGRTHSVRTEDEELELLFEEIQRLPEKERAALVEVYEKLVAGKEDGFSSVVDTEYETIPVDVKTFLSDSYYMGEVGRSLWPKLHGDMEEVFSGGYSEAILGGSIGWGKSFFATLALTYVLYQMLCLRSPQRAYGIDPGSNIYLAMLSVTEKTARRVVINEFIGKITASPFFREVGYKSAPSMMEIRFPKSIQVVAGSTGSSAIIGLNAFSGLIDESSFMGNIKQADRHGKIVSIDQGEAIYKSINRRMKSRFQRVGTLPGVLFVISSKERPSAFIEKKIIEARERQDPTVFIREYSTWDVKSKDHFSTATFKVVSGDERVQSRILSGDQEEEQLYRDMGLQIIEVPVDYRKDFENDIDGSLRDIAGIATESVSPYFQRSMKIFESIYEDLPVATDVDEVVDGGLFRIHWGRIAEQYTRTLPGGFEEQAWRPLRHPGAARYAHVDPSLTGDATGVVIAHISGWTEVVRKGDDGEEYNEIAPVIETDFEVRVVPPPGDEIDFGNIRSIIYQFQEHGFHIAFVSMDSWNSADALQQYRKRGIEAEVASVDRTTMPYDVLKSAFYEGRIRTSGNEVLVRELRNLQRVPRTSGGFKIDHPATDSDGKPGSKDIADALAGVVYALTQRSPGRPIPPVRSGTTQAAVEREASWVTGGLVQVDRGAASRQPKTKSKDFPLPFVRG